MSLVDTFASAIEGFASDHPFVTMGIVLTVLYITKEPIGSLLDNTRNIVTGVTDPSRQQLNRWRDSWSANANTDEALIRKHHGQGILTGTLTSVVFLSFVAVLVVLNFGLILRPLQDILASGQFMGLPLALVGALAIAAAEFVVGAVLLNALGWSYLIPLRKREDSKQPVLLAIAVIAMLVLSGIEAGLSVYREELRAADVSSQESSLPAPVTPGDQIGPPASVGDAVSDANSVISSTPAWVQAALGFLLPWIVAITVMPVEMLLRIAPVIFRRIGGVAAWVPEAACAVTSNVFTHGVAGIKAILEIVTKPADVIYKGLRPIIRRMAPQLFETR